MGLGLAACGSHRNFVELKAHDRTFGEIWEGIDQVASSDGFRVDSSETDRGRGIYQTRWDRKVLNLGRSGRRRLHAEIVPDPDATEHSMVRFYVEQEKVTDLGKTFNVEERDWDSAGQDTQYQQIFVERLARVLGLLQSSNGPSSGPSSGPSRGQVPTR